jgi:hypothetical protein
MPAKRANVSGIRIQPLSERDRNRSSQQRAFGVITGNAKLRGGMSAKSTASENSYLCAIERNQSGKYDVRVRAVFSRDGWTLPVYFLASTFNGAMKKLGESLQFLQKNEERLRFWGLERTDDPTLAGDLLKECGLSLDRRRDLPRKVAELGIAREIPFSSSVLASMRRVLADSLAEERVAHRPALAGD